MNYKLHYSKIARSVATCWEPQGGVEGRRQRPRRRVGAVFQRSRESELGALHCHTGIMETSVTPAAQTAHGQVVAVDVTLNLSSVPFTLGALCRAKQI